jgi:hypothetical protein
VGTLSLGGIDVDQRCQSSACMQIQLGFGLVRCGSWLRENSEIEFANGNFVSTSINLKNKRAGDGCQDKTIEKTIPRAFHARTFSRSQGQTRKSHCLHATSVVPSRADVVRPPRQVRFVPTTDLHKPPEGVRVHLDGRQRRDAPCGSVADQHGKHEINGLQTVRSSSGGRGGHKCVRRILEEGSNNGATAPADEHQLAVGGLPLSEDILSYREVAGRMIGS